MPEEEKTAADERHRLQCFLKQRLFNEHGKGRLCCLPPASRHGSCAVVSNSKELLKYELGHHIDANDVVIRLTDGQERLHARHAGEKVSIRFGSEGFPERLDKDSDIFSTILKELYELYPTLLGQWKPEIRPSIEWSATLLALSSCSKVVLYGFHADESHLQLMGSSSDDTLGQRFGETSAERGFWTRLVTQPEHGVIQQGHATLLGLREVDCESSAWKDAIRWLAPARLLSDGPSATGVSDRFLQPTATTSEMMNFHDFPNVGSEDVFFDEETLILDKGKGKGTDWSSLLFLFVLVLLQVGIACFMCRIMLLGLLGEVERQEPSSSRRQATATAIVAPEEPEPDQKQAKSKKKRIQAQARE